MEPENKSAGEIDYNLLYEYFLNMERQGPGSPETTIKALSFIDNHDKKSRIADIGCGTGGQTLVLAEHTTGDIVGIDLSSVFIEKFNYNVDKNNLQNRIKGITGSMDNLPFQNGEFDIIWSEGAIDHIGFEKGINYWRKFLGKGGYIAVTNASWFTNERPSEIEKFWLDAVPEVGTVGQNVSIMQKAGYVPVASFIIPENCWTETYFAPQVPLQEKFLKKYAGNKDVEDFIESCRWEAQLYEKYKKYYGYVFYIGKKME